MSAETLALLARAEALRGQKTADATLLAEGLAAAQQAWDSTTDTELRRRAGLMRTHFHYRRGELLQLLNAGLVVLPLVAAGSPPAEHFELLRVLAIAACDTGRFDIALPFAHRAHGMAVGLGDPGLQALGLNAIACCFERMGDPWQAERLMGESLTLARRSPQPMALFSTLNNLMAVQLGMYHLMRDALPTDDARAPLQRALPMAREAQHLAQGLGDPFMRVFADGNAGEVLTHLGEHAEARGTLNAALQTARQIDARMQQWRIECTLGELALLEGHAQHAWELLKAVLQASGGTDAPVTHLRLHYALWLAAKARRRPTEALYHLEQFEVLSRRRSLRQMRAQSELLITRAELAGPGQAGPASPSSQTR